ncbi:YbaB/EbfC family nucleoid-associated protein [Actinosynnema sp. NPDC051121]
MDAAQWPADYRERLERAAHGARAASASLREVGATATSPRGEVSVTVNAGGLVDDVTLTPAARRLEADALSVLIVATAREAQRPAGDPDAPLGAMNPTERPLSALDGAGVGVLTPMISFLEELA